MTSSPLAAAVYFGPAGQARFGFYHAPVGARRAVGVVVCGPIGDDEVRAHRPLRHLAEQLSGLGFPTLRFDWLGTGDSAGDARSPALVSAWLDDIQLATAALRAHSGVERVVLLGLKLGATLALAAAPSGSDVDAVVAWGAYGSGSEFVAERVGLHRMRKTLEPQSFAAGPADGSPDGKEALGFLLTPATIAGLENLVAIPVAGARPAAAVLLIGTGNLPHEPLAARLQKLGVDVQTQHVPGQKFLLVPPHRAALPTPAFDVITRWLEARYPERKAAPAPSVPSVPARAGDGERALRFGDSSLFGILTAADAAAAQRLSPTAQSTALVILNAGCVHRIGPHRLSVALARRWAQGGNAVLRFDLSGIGDSPAQLGSAENQQYPDGAQGDVQAALAAVEAATGARRFILVGAGSGADIAFAVAKRDPRVVGLVLLNPYTFCQNPAQLIESYRHARRYGSSIFRAQTWRRMLSGEIDLNHALRTVLPRAADLVRRKLSALVPGASSTSEDVPAVLRQMAARGVDVLLLAGEDDPGVAFLQSQSGALAALDGASHFRRETLHGVDQTFTSAYAQALVSDIVTDHLQRAVLS